MKISTCENFSLNFTFLLLSYSCFSRLFSRMCLQIKSDEKIGRFLVAKRAITKNTKLFTEAPLIIGPKWSRDVEDESLSFRCVGCYEPIPVLNCKCPGCHWPACSIQCIGLINSDLHQVECGMLRVGKGELIYERLLTI